VTTRRWKALLLGGIALSLAVVFAVDLNTGAAPFEHLYYLRIVFAGLELPWFAGPLVGVIAIVLYHIANPALLTARYHESDIVQIVLFVVIGVVTAQLAEDRRRLQHLAITDDLTGLLNLRGFEDRLSATIETARDRQEPVSVLVLDVDRLKSINDTHGHRAGADSVKTVGAVIAAHLPLHGFACRFGGDEFVAALPGCDRTAAERAAENIRRAVHATEPHLAGTRFPAGALSVSIGVASLSAVDDRDGESMKGESTGETLFRAADEALYRAKAAGRNRVGLVTV
jgi:diguanylate cyclase (GGDEF)-like protein